MPDLATYCERCGETFAARYDATRHLLILECRRCGYTYQGIGLSAFQALPESQRHTLYRLVERTAMAAGEPVPTIIVMEQETKKAPPPVVYPAVKIPPLKLVQPTPDAPLGLLVQPLLPPEAFRAHAEAMAQRICQQFLVPPLKLVWTEGAPDLDKMARVQKFLDLAKQCQLKKR